MKIIYLTCALLSLAVLSALATGEWVAVNSPVTQTLRVCVMTDSQYGWAAGDDGVIICTTNGGLTFFQQTNPVPYYVNDLYFLNNRLGWIISNEAFPGGSTIVRTTNGGLNWIAYDFQDSTKLLRSIFFQDSLIGYVAGFGGAICKTTDGGLTWLESPVDTSSFSGFPINKISFEDQLTGFAVGGYIDVAGVIWRTTNAGALWKAGDYSPEPFFDLYTFVSGKVLAVGGDFEYGVQMSFTNNSGQNWTYNNLGIFGQGYSIDFRTASEAWMTTGYGGNWAVTYDTGNTWTSLPVSDAAVLYSVDFGDSLHGIAVGSGGTIFRYDPGPSSTEQSIALLPSEISVSAYPNPFNPVSSLTVDIPFPGTLFISVYDASGRLAGNIAEGELVNAGKNTYLLDGSGLSSGIYFVSARHITTGGITLHSKSIKTVLLK
ncbi:MAG: T9SS type A sorting domain-containing protein [Ignavibacteria bacterium]|nr:T9SS type A sorting domain-containing protein [Ignavibacteria bacterium]